MAQNLVAAGIPVIVWNRTRAKATALAKFGIDVADELGAAASDAVILMLENESAVHEVLFVGGLADAMKPGSTVIDMSSISPVATRTHADHLAEVGIGHLDAPVSGGVSGAVQGTLAIMVGGERSEFERRRPLLAPLGKTTYVGTHGCGQVAKLTNQIIVAVTIGAVAEGLLFAAAAGTEPAVVREALSGGHADSRILREHGQRMLDRSFGPGGTVQIQLKDMRNVLAAAEQAKIQLPLTGAVTALFERLAKDGFAGLDHSALLLELERMNISTGVDAD